MTDDGLMLFKPFILTWGILLVAFYITAELVDLGCSQVSAKMYSRIQPVFISEELELP